MIAPFFSAEWVQAHRDEVVLADVRFYMDGRSPVAAFEAAHIGGALYVDLEAVLAGPASDAEGRHPLPSPERFAEGLTRAGIGETDTVIGYDDAGGVIAARLVWMLRAIGHEAALLEGGLEAWPGERESGPPAASKAAIPVTPKPWPRDQLATIDEVARGEAELVDARDPERYAGLAPDPVDPRAGHIPGAVNLPARGPLREIEGDVISYCGSGVTACFNLLRLGRGRLYPGSWSQWSRDPSRPIETEEPAHAPR